MNLKFPKSTVVEKEQRSAFLKYWLRRIFIDDWMMKSTALLITFVLWAGVTGLRTPKKEVFRHVLLKLRVSNQLQITNSPVNEVEIEVIGDERKLPRASADLDASLDLRNVPVGEHVVNITADNLALELESGVRIQKVTPEKLLIKLEKVEEHEVPIKAEWTGDPASGYEVYSSKVTPEKVKIRGPKSFVDSLNFVSTEKISVENQTDNFRAQQIPLNVVNPNVTLVDAVSANVFFRIGKKRIERLFVKSYETDTRTGRASVLLYGPASVLEGLSADDLEITEDRTETKVVKLWVLLPNNMKDEVEVKSVKFRE